MTYNPVNFDKLQREDYSRTHRYPYTSAYIQSSAFGDTGTSKRDTKAIHNIHHDMFTGEADYLKLLHEPGSYYHRLDPRYLTQHSGWANRWPYKTNTYDGKEYSKWTNDLHRQYAGQYEKDRETNALFARRDKEAADADRFVSNRDKKMYVREGMLNTPPLFLTPSRLYDNPDYKFLRQKSNLC